MAIQTLSRNFAVRFVDHPVVKSITGTDHVMQQKKESQEHLKTLADTHELVKKVQKVADMFNREIQFRVNEKIDKVVVTVIDSKTSQVIREIPSKDIQRLEEHLQEVLGILFDETV